MKYDSWVFFKQPWFSLPLHPPSFILVSACLPIRAPLIFPISLLSGGGLAFQVWHPWLNPSILSKNEKTISIRLYLCHSCETRVPIFSALFITQSRLRHFRLVHYKPINFRWLLLTVIVIKCFLRAIGRHRTVWERSLSVLLRRAYQLWGATLCYSAEVHCSQQRKHQRT